MAAGSQQWPDSLGRNRQLAWRFQTDSSFMSPWTSLVTRATSGSTMACRRFFAFNDAGPRKGLLSHDVNGSLSKARQALSTRSFDLGVSIRPAMVDVSIF